MRMSRIVFLAVFLSGCGHNLRPDTSLPSIQANYPTAEFRACGKVWHGLGACEILEGEPLDRVDLKIQGYYKGTVRIVSADCQIDDTFRYDNNALIHYSIAGSGSKSCVVSFVVSPEYPNEATSAIVIHSLKGYLFVRVSKPDEHWEFYRARVPESGVGHLVMPLELNQPARVLASGCGMKFDRVVQPEGGNIVLSYSDIIGPITVKGCILQGLLIDGAVQRFFTAMVWGYDKRYVPLATPVVSEDGGKIRVDGGSEVSVVSLDALYRISNKGSFKFDKTKNHVLRILTVAGRSKLGIWAAGGDRWEWE